MNVYDEVLYAKMIEVDREITVLWRELESLIISPPKDVKKAHKAAIELHSKIRKAQKRFLWLRQENKAVTPGTTTMMLIESNRVRLMAVTGRMLDGVFDVEPEGDQMIEKDDIVTVQTVRGNNRFQGKFVSTSPQGVVIIREGHEMHIPLDNIEYVSKVQRAT